MAHSAEDPVERLQDEVSCSICLEYLRDPVTIDCGHNFCQACISDYCQQGAGSTTGAALCPQCRVGFLLSSSRPNKQLANIVEGIARLARRPSQEIAEALCEKHGKKLSLFCQDDEESICLICVKSQEHRMHSVLTIEEAAHNYRMKVQGTVDMLRKTLAEAIKLEVQEKEKTDQWKNKVKKHRALIVSGFEKRRQVMAEEEKLLLKHLQEEELGTLKKLERNSDFLLEQRVTMQNIIIKIEQTCQKPAATLIKDVKKTSIRIEALSLKEPQPVSMELQDSYDVPGLMESLQRYNASVTFDPDTANPYLLLSEDLLSVQVVDQRRPISGSLLESEEDDWCNSCLLPNSISDSSSLLEPSDNPSGLISSVTPGSSNSSSSIKVSAGTLTTQTGSLWCRHLVFSACAEAGFLVACKEANRQ